MTRLVIVRSLVCAALFLGAQPVALAQANRDALIESAAKARKSGDLEQALTLLEKANALAAAPELINNIAKVLEELGRYAEAAAQYKLVADDPNADGDLRALDASRYAALQSKVHRAWLWVDVAPEAKLAVDGRAVSQANAEVGLTPGAHRLELRMPGSKTLLIRTVDLPKGRRVRFDATLGSKRAGVIVSLEGVSDEVTGFELAGIALAEGREAYVELDLPPGDHTLFLVGGPARTVQIRGDSGANVRLSELIAAQPPPPPAGGAVAATAGEAGGGLGRMAVHRGRCGRGRFGRGRRAPRGRERRSPTGGRRHRRRRRDDPVSDGEGSRRQRKHKRHDRAGVVDARFGRRGGWGDLVAPGIGR